MSDIKAVVPDTGEELTLPADTMEGEIVVADDGSEWEVVAIKDGVATLEAAPEVDEDWGE